MNNSRANKEVMSAYSMHRETGKMRYTLIRSTVDKRDAFSISVMQITPSGDINYKEADDVCCEKDCATALFRAIAEGEVEPCLLYDILYDILP